MKKLLAASALLVMMAGTALAKSGIDPAAYPSLDRKQMGTVRHFVELSRTPLDAWDYRSYATEDTNDLRYIIAHVSTGLALAQHGITPAYRDLYQQAQNALIEKMIDSRVWNYWYNMSRYKISSDPYGGEVKPWRDPVKKMNIMYSAYLFQMVGYYRVLYDDPKFDAPGSLTFSYNYRPFDPNSTAFERVPYDHKKLAKAIYDQYVSNGFRGIECLPNAVFQPCNAYPQAAFIHFDASHGTSYAPKVIAGLQNVSDKFQKKIGEGSDWYIYEISTGDVKALPPGISEPITPMYRHIWDRETVAARYERDRDAMVPLFLSNKIPWTDKREGTSALFGAFVGYAAELRDMETAAKMLAFADENLKPVWKDGQYFYPAHYPDDKNAVPMGKEYGVEMLGNAMIGEARLNEGAGLWRLYNEIWTKDFFAQPYIGGVDYPRALVNQAIYDAAKDALVVGLEPGAKKAGTVSVNVHNLDRAKTYAIELDGKEIGTVAGGKASVKKGAGRWSADNVMTLDIDLDRPRSLVIYATKGA